jgi:hypothetical protein
MSKEQITCGDCGYQYRGCTAVDHCPQCQEDVELEQQVKVLKDQKAELVKALEAIEESREARPSSGYCGPCRFKSARARLALKQVKESE